MATPDASKRARTAVLATCGLYTTYGLLGLVPGLDIVRGAALVAAFYFLPGWLLRHEPEVQARYQVGPDGPIPPWDRRGARWALGACLVVFPPFVLGFWWFYHHVCAGDLRMLAPALWVEALTPWHGGLEQFFQRLCRGHDGTFFPDALHVPASWAAYGGLGVIVQVVEGLFAVALAEEVFHRGYLMSALEERFPPKRTIFGAKIGLAAVISSLLFALGHLFSMAQAARLATFFPALVFAWLWRRSGSLWAPALFHMAANLLMELLLASTFRG